MQYTQTKHTTHPTILNLFHSLSLYTLAPEILKKETISTATDMWSLGVLLYTFIGGTATFLVDSLDLTKDNICSVRYTFPTKSFKGVSDAAKQLIAGLLVKDKRLERTGI